MSHISVSSATQITRDEMDVETDASPQLRDLDHPYSAPHQVAEVTDGPETLLQPGDHSPENSAPIPTATGDTGPHYTVAIQDIKQEYDELKSVKLEPAAVNLSPVSSGYPQEQFSQGVDQTWQSYSQNLENGLITGLIMQIAIKDVPYSVTHDDLIKALSVSDDKIAVRTMRKVIPCLRITTYNREADFLGKKKIKGLWTTKPNDWPEHTPYKDPNNGEKVDGRLVPKANSEELKQMFVFLKRKFMLNIQDKLRNLSNEELERLKSTASQQTQEYDFSCQQPSTPKSSSPTYSQSQLHRSSQSTKEPVLVKPELGQYFTTPPIAEGNQIPTLVNDFCNSSPEAEYVNNQPQQVYPLTTDYAGLELSPGQYVQYTDESGNQVLVRMIDSPSSSEEEASPVPETVLETAQDVRAIKRPAPVETGGASPVVVSGKRVCEEEDTTSRDPIQVSSPSPEVTSIQTPVLSTPKATIEVAPQLRSNTATPQSVLPQPTQQTPRSAIQMSPAPYNQGGIGVTVYSPVSPMAHNPSSQYRTDLRGTLIHDLHSRIREKINFVSNLTLGDVDLSIKLNTMYQSVLWNHYQRAQRNEPNNFINAVHACEALVERAIMDGTNFSRNSFKDDCNAIIVKYTGEEELTQKLVLNVAEPEHPPIQSQLYTKLQSESVPSLPSAGYPKSPGTFLSKEMGLLQLDKSNEDKVDVAQLGIRTKVQPSEVLKQLQNMGVLQRTRHEQPEESDNLLSLPKKLAAIRCEVSPDQINDQALKDLLFELNKLTGGTVPDQKTKAEVSTVHEFTEVITIDDDEVITIDHKENCTVGQTINLQQSLPQELHTGRNEVTVSPPSSEGQLRIIGQPVQTGRNAGAMDPCTGVYSHQAPGLWPLAQREMEQALAGKDQPSGLVTSDNDLDMDTDELLNSVIGLEETYESYSVLWRDSDNVVDRQTEFTNRAVQPSTSDNGHLYVSPQKPGSQPPPPYPGHRQENPGEFLNLSSDAHQYGVWNDLNLAANQQTGVNEPAHELSIPEVVENFEQMDCTATEPKPGTRGRKRGPKGKAKN